MQGRPSLRRARLGGGENALALASTGSRQSAAWRGVSVLGTESPGPLRARLGARHPPRPRADLAPHLLTSFTSLHSLYFRSSARPPGATASSAPLRPSHERAPTRPVAPRSSPRLARAALANACVQHTALAAAVTACARRPASSRRRVVRATASQPSAPSAEHGQPLSRLSSRSSFPVRTRRCRRTSMSLSTLLAAELPLLARARSTRGPDGARGRQLASASHRALSALFGSPTLRSPLDKPLGRAGGRLLASEGQQGVRAGEMRMLPRSSCRSAPAHAFSLRALGTLDVLHSSRDAKERKRDRQAAPESRDDALKGRGRERRRERCRDPPHIARSPLFSRANKRTHMQV